MKSKSEFRDKLKKEVRGVRIRDLMEASRQNGELKGENRVLKYILYQLLNLKEESRDGF